MDKETFKKKICEQLQVIVDANNAIDDILRTQVKDLNEEFFSKWKLRIGGVAKVTFKDYDGTEYSKKLTYNGHVVDRYKRSVITCWGVVKKDGTGSKLYDHVTYDWASLNVVGVEKQP